MGNFMDMEQDVIDSQFELYLEKIGGLIRKLQDSFVKAQRKPNRLLKREDLEIMRNIREDLNRAVQTFGDLTGIR